MQRQEEFDDIYKIILIGDSSVGKTNIIYMYAKEKVPTNVMPTIGVEYTSKSIKLGDGTFVKAQIWDTAGQEQYRAVTMSHYRKAAGAIIVFDVTNRTSFTHVMEWLTAVRQRAETNVQIMIVGHKIDQIRRQVSKQQAQAFASREHVSYGETTIRNSEGIRQVFLQLLTNVAKEKRSQSKGMRLNADDINGQGQGGCSC